MPPLCLIRVVIWVSPTPILLSWATYPIVHHSVPLGERRQCIMEAAGSQCSMGKKSSPGVQTLEENGNMRHPNVNSHEALQWYFRIKNISDFGQSLKLFRHSVFQGKSKFSRESRHVLQKEKNCLVKKIQFSFKRQYRQKIFDQP